MYSVIQAAMGWLDYHLWSSRQERKYSVLIPNDPDWNERIKRRGGQTVCTPDHRRNGDQLYLLTLATTGQHGSLSRNSSPPNPERCILSSRRRAAMPTRGLRTLPGYYDFLDNIASKQSKKRKAALDWYGRPTTRTTSMSSNHHQSQKIANPRRHSADQKPSRRDCLLYYTVRSWS